jgi:hypothetical protein
MIPSFRDLFCLVSTAAEGSIPVTLDHHDTANGRNPLVVTLGGYAARYRMVLYVLFAVVWNWNWLTGAEVFRLLAALPYTFMMLMYLTRLAGREKEPVNQWRFVPSK